LWHRIGVYRIVNCIDAGIPQADITGVNQNKTIIESLKNGAVIFEEKGLNELFQSAVKNNCGVIPQF